MPSVAATDPPPTYRFELAESPPIGHHVRVSADTRLSPTIWRYATAISVLLVVGLLFAAAKIATHSVDRNGLNCGSVVKPSDVEAFGPGTNVRPCGGTHDADLGMTLLLLLTAGVVIVVLVRCRPEVSDDQRVAENAATS